MGSIKKLSWYLWIQIVLHLIVQVFNLFRFIFSFLSFLSLHPTPPTHTMTLGYALHTLLSLYLMIIFQLLSIYIFYYFTLFFIPLIRFNCQWQWTGDPHQETPPYILLSHSFVAVFNSNLFIWMHLFLYPLFMMCTLTLPVHQQ